MKKTVFLFLLMTAAVSLMLYYFYSLDNDIHYRGLENDEKEKIQEKSINFSQKNESSAKLPKTSLSKKETTSKTKTTTKTKKNKVFSSTIEEREKRDHDLNIKIKENWLKGVKSYFLDQLGMSESDYEDYLQLREDFKRDRDIAYGHYVQRMKDKYGENYQTNINSVDEVFRNQNYAEYTSALSDLIGQDNLERYFIYKSEFNESIEDIIDEDQEYLLIEY